MAFIRARIRGSAIIGVSKPDVNKAVGKQEN